MPKAKTVSLKQFARELDVTPKAVRNAIESGRLTTATCQKAGGKWHIKLNAAKREFRQRNPAYQAARSKKKTKAKPKKKAAAKKPAKAPKKQSAEQANGTANGKMEPGLFGPMPPLEPEFEEPDDDGQVDEDDDGTGVLSHHVRYKKVQADMLELEFQKRSGLLVPRAEMESEAYSTYRRVRDRLVAMKARIKNELAATQDPNACEAILDREIRAAIAEIAAGAEGEE